MPENDSQKTYKKDELYDIDVKALQSDPDQPRKFMNSESIDLLADTIKEHGVLQPILFREEGGKLIVVIGARRLEAAKKAGMSTIPARFFDGRSEEVALIENLQREDLTQIEFAEALYRVKEDYDYNQDELASTIGKAESTVSEILKLNDLPKEIRDECRGNHDISRNDLLKIARNKGSMARKKAFEEYKASHTDKKHPKVRPWPERLIAGCNNMKAIMEKEDIGNLGDMTIDDLVTRVNELKEGAERLLEKIQAAKMGYGGCTEDHNDHQVEQ